MNSMYYDFAMTVKNKLCEEINGRIVFETYKNIDTIIFKVFFKDFEFAYAMANIQDFLYSGKSADDVIEEFKREYLKVIKKTFFKSDNRKKRDELIKMGVPNEEE